MLLRPLSKVVALIGPVLILVYLFYSYFDEEPDAVNHVGEWIKSKTSPYGSSQESDSNDAPTTPSDTTRTEEPLPIFPQEDSASEAGIHIELPPPPPPQELLLGGLADGEAPGNFAYEPAKYIELSSLSTSDGKFFPIDFGLGFEGLNPSIIPHPQKADTWIVTAQREKNSSIDRIFEEIMCSAQFRPDGVLACVTPAATLPIGPTRGPWCTGDLEYFGLNVGPHDMRLAWGPDAPYAVYGSQSAHTCFGMWVQDVRALDPLDFAVTTLDVGAFSLGTELQRPAPWGRIEKNWFLFWDAAGTAYVHHDIEPRRAFAQLTADGSVGPDLAPLAGDGACLAALMPHPQGELENLHQATNSLAVTMCARADPGCAATGDNTFVLSIFQLKTFHEWHGVYEPYALLFRQTPPFAAHAVSRRPLWIRGRGALTADSHSVKWERLGKLPEGHSEMFYITSLSWKEQGARYHGFLDDILFLGFGIEDSRSGGIEVRASDLLQDLGFCTDVLAEAA